MNNSLGRLRVRHKRLHCGCIIRRHIMRMEPCFPTSVNERLSCRGCVWREKRKMRSCSRTTGCRSSPCVSSCQTVVEQVLLHRATTSSADSHSARTCCIREKKSGRRPAHAFNARASRSDSTSAEVGGNNETFNNSNDDHMRSNQLKYVWCPSSRHVRDRRS